MRILLLALKYFGLTMGLASLTSHVHAYGETERVYVAGHYMLLDLSGGATLENDLKARGHNVSAVQQDEQTNGVGFSIAGTFKDGGVEGGIEVGYHYIEGFDSTVEVVSPNLTALRQDIHDLQPATGSQMYLALRWAVPVWRNLQLECKAGMVKAFGGETKVRHGNESFTLRSENQSGYLFAAGLRYRIPDDWYIRADYLRTHVGDNSGLDGVSVGVEWAFY